MTVVWVLIPVLNRPHRVDELLRSLHESEQHATLLPNFLVSPGDHAERAAIARLEARYDMVVTEFTFPAGRGDYARKINAGARHAHGQGADWVFLGADDLCFCKGWADAAIRVGDATAAKVVGTNDLGNPLVRAGQHATHSLARPDYVGTFDGQDGLLHEGYDHQYVDTELVYAARQRGVWAFAQDSHVEHLHPLWRKGQHDTTYEKGLRDGPADLMLYQRRQQEFEAGLATVRLGR